MTDEKSRDGTQVQVAKIGVIGVVIGAILTAFLTPLANSYFNKPSPPVESKVLAIEQISQEVFSFTDADNQNGIAELRVLYTLAKPPAYTLVYDLPTDRFGAVGIAFKFDQGVNVFDYKSMHFTIQFEQANQSIDLYLADIANSKASTRIVSTGTVAMNVSFPLNNFTSINLNALKEINFYTQTDANIGHHKIIIQNIRFVK